MIKINITKAKEIAHNARRVAREEEFAPLDKAVAIQISPEHVAAAEKQRKQIREKYAVLQIEIDKATTPEDIKKAMAF